MSRREYARVAGTTMPGYAILEESNGQGVLVEFLDETGQPYPGEHVLADGVEDAKKAAAQTSRSNLLHWREIPLDAADPIEYARGHANALSRSQPVGLDSEGLAMPVDWNRYACGACSREIDARDVVVQTMRIVRRPAADLSVIEEQLTGEWFHADCWGQGIAPYREIGRGPLATLLARSDLA
jgi:hypothetical protein